MSVCGQLCMCECVFVYDMCMWVLCLWMSAQGWLCMCITLQGWAGIYAWLCMWVCVCSCMCMSECEHVHDYICVWLCMCLCMYVQDCMLWWAHIHTCLWEVKTSTWGVVFQVPPPWFLFFDWQLYIHIQYIMIIFTPLPFLGPSYSYWYHSFFFGVMSFVRLVLHSPFVGGTCVCVCVHACNDDS